MKGEWCYFRKHFSPEQCEQIIRDAALIPSQDGHVGTDQGVKTDPKIRRSKIKFIPSNNWTYQWFFDDLWKMAIQANRDFFDVHVSQLNFVQLAEYSALDQGEYRAHHDVFWINQEIYHRKLTCLVQLTDPTKYQGGDFELLDVGQFPPANEIREQGTVIFFPSFFLHQATPVTQGVRHSIAAWFEGPKWR